MYQIFNRVDFQLYRDGLTIRIIWKRQSFLSLLVSALLVNYMLQSNVGTSNRKLNFDNKFNDKLNEGTNKGKLNFDNKFSLTCGLAFLREI